MSAKKGGDPTGALVTVVKVLEWGADRRRKALGASVRGQSMGIGRCVTDTRGRQPTAYALYGRSSRAAHASESSRSKKHS